MAIPIRVLTILHDTRRSGVPAVAVNIITALPRDVVTPTVLCAYDGVYAEDLRKAGVEVQTLGVRTPLLWRLKRFLLNVVLVARRREFDLIHIHSTKLVWSVLTAKLLGLRTVFHLHELPRRIGPLLRYAISAADAVVFCSRTCADHYEKLGVRRGVTIVNALAFSSEAPVVHTPENRRIVMAASINRNKGQDLALEAFARLQYPDAELFLYGTVGLSARGFVHDLKKRAMELGVAGRVHFPGPTADVIPVFRKAAVMVHTSWTESFGMALVEAQSCGVPVIAHDLEGMREVVQNGVSGYLIPPGDVGILAEKLDKLLSSQEMRTRMGNAGFDSVRHSYDIHSRVIDYMKLYSSVTESSH